MRALLEHVLCARISVGILKCTFPFHSLASTPSENCLFNFLLSKPRLPSGGVTFQGPSLYGWDVNPGGGCWGLSVPDHWASLPSTEGYSDERQVFPLAVSTLLEHLCAGTEESFPGSSSLPGCPGESSGGHLKCAHVWA